MPLSDRTGGNGAGIDSIVCHASSMFALSKQSGGASDCYAPSANDAVSIDASCVVQGSHFLKDNQEHCNFSGSERMALVAEAAKRQQRQNSNTTAAAEQRQQHWPHWWCWLSQWHAHMQHLIEPSVHFRLEDKFYRQSLIQTLTRIT